MLVLNLNVTNEVAYSIGIAKHPAGPHTTTPPLTGATFELYAANYDGSIPDPLGEVLATITDDNGNDTPDEPKDKDGFYQFTGLTLGKYLVVETKAPDGYLLDSTPRLVDLALFPDMPDTTTPKEWAKKNDYIFPVLLFNERARSIEITKTDSETGAALTGAQFELYAANDDGTVPSSLGAVLATITDDNGNGTLDEPEDKDGHYQFTGLKLGKYLVVEKTAPGGYVLDSTPVLADLTTLGPDIPVLELDITNEKIVVPPDNPTPPPTPEPTDYNNDDDPPATLPPVTPRPSSSVAPTTTPTSTPAPTSEPTPVPSVPVETPTPIVTPSVTPTPTTTNTLTLNDDGTFTEIDENGVPLGTWTWDDELEMWIFDPFVPLGGLLPKTGGSADAAIFLILATLSLTGIAMLSNTKKRKH